MSMREQVVNYSFREEEDGTLVFSESHHDRFRIMDTTNPPRAHQEALARHHEPDMRKAIATNPDLDDDLANILAADAVTRVRAAVAGHPGLTRGALSALARDGSSRVRSRVAGRRDLLPDDWEALGHPSRRTKEVERRLRKAGRRHAVLVLGVDQANEAAQDYLCQLEWWNLTKDSDEVFIATTLHSNLER